MARLTEAKKRAITKIFDLTDEELQEWLEDEGEEEILKVFKILEPDFEEPEKERIEYGEEVGDVGKMRDGLQGIRQLARNIPEKTLRSQIVAQVDALLKQLGVVQKSLGYDPRTGMTESPEIAYIKAKMQSNW